eukprot:52100-Eustigmatos_ZCMA.PRE.1
MYKHAFVHLSGATGHLGFLGAAPPSSFCSSICSSSCEHDSPHATQGRPRKHDSIEAVETGDQIQGFT